MTDNEIRTMWKQMIKEFHEINKSLKEILKNAESPCYVSTTELYADSVVQEELVK